MELITSLIEKKEDMNAIRSYKTAKLLVPVLCYVLILAREAYRRCRATGRCHTKAVSGWETWKGVAKLLHIKSTQEHRSVRKTCK